MFRLHPEFQLNEPPLFPFWFTPASFMGELTIKKDGSHIEHFDMYLPTRKQLNIGRFIPKVRTFKTVVNPLKYLRKLGALSQWGRRAVLRLLYIYLRHRLDSLASCFLLFPMVMFVSGYSSYQYFVVRARIWGQKIALFLCDRCFLIVSRNFE